MAILSILFFLKKDFLKFFCLFVCLLGALFLSLLFVCCRFGLFGVLDIVFFLGGVSLLVFLWPFLFVCLLLLLLLCVRACVRAFVRACVRAFVCV